MMFMSQKPEHPVTARFAFLVAAVTVLAIWLFSPGKAGAGLVIFDDVTTPGVSFFLKVQTTRMIFPDGGQRVEVQVDREDERAILTGGDGCGYVKMQFTGTGMKTLAARSKNDRNQALVLVIDPGTPVLVIEIAAVFNPALFRENGLDTCRRVLKTLSERYPIVYLGGTIGVPVIRDWLMNHGFPPGPVLSGQGMTTLRMLQRRGVCAGVLLGSAKLTETAGDLVKNRFCFEKTSRATHTDGWEDFQERLTSGDHPSICRPAPGDGVQKKMK
jgi:hypothetical protein